MTLITLHLRAFHAVTTTMSFAFKDVTCYNDYYITYF